VNTDNFHCRREELARIFGVKQQHISRLVAEGMPRVKHGVYDLPACLQWVTQRIGRIGSLEPDHPGDVGVARRNLYLAQAKHKKLQIQQLETELIHAHEVRKNISQLGTCLIDALDEVPKRAACDLAACSTIPEGVAILRRHCIEVREELANELSVLAGEQTSELP
jgi:phage terminase Nu1 subunit (DNA packaging protein)